MTLDNFNNNCGKITAKPVLPSAPVGKALYSLHGFKIQDIYKDLQFCHLPKKQDRLNIEAEDFDFFNKNSIRWEGSLLFTRVQDSRYLPQLVQQQGPTILHTADSIQLDSSASR